MQYRRQPFLYCPFDRFSCNSSTTNLHKFISAALPMSLYLFATSHKHISTQKKLKMKKRENGIPRITTKSIKLYQHGVTLITDFDIKCWGQHSGHRVNHPKTLENVVCFFVLRNPRSYSRSFWPAAFIGKQYCCHIFLILVVNIVLHVQSTTR